MKILTFSCVDAELYLFQICNIIKNYNINLREEIEVGKIIMDMDAIKEIVYMSELKIT